MDEEQQLEGFGYLDAMDVEQREPKWIIEEILPEGFGYIAGAPKANNSPHGGKTVLSLSMMLAMLWEKHFLQRNVIRQAPILVINLDQPQHEISGKVKKMLQHGEKRGLMISKAYSMKLPDDLARVEGDIVSLKAKIVVIDPLLRCVGGKDIKDATNTGPIIDGLKRLRRKYDITIIVVHHCIKNPDRDKETTASWLSGSTDLDSSWDFCLCLSWDKHKNSMHLRGFFRNFGRTDIYYRAVKNDDDDIIALEPADGDTPNLKWQKIKDVLGVGNKTVPEIYEATGIPESTIKRNLKRIEGKETQIVGKRGNAPVWGLIEVTGLEMGNSGHNEK